MSTAAEIIGHMSESIKNPTDSGVGPGHRVRFSEASSPGDCIAQGDVEFVRVAAIDAAYQRRPTPNVNIVWGEEGEQTHRIADPTAVEFYDNQAWGAESLDGPQLRVIREVEVLHSGAGAHGTVVLTPGCYAVSHPRVWDREQASELRARD